MNKKVPFKIPKITCEDSGQIPYTDCEEAEKTQMVLGLSCSVEKSVHCQPVTELKCKRITYTELQQSPVENCENILIWIPIQKKEHKKKCLLPDISTMLDSEKNYDNFV